MVFMHMGRFYLYARETTIGNIAAHTLAGI